MDIYDLSTGAITAVGVSLLVIFGIVGLIIWNNKTKEQVKALKSIDAKMKEAETLPAEASVVVKIKAEAMASETPPAPEQPLEILETEEQDGSQEEEATETTAEAAEAVEAEDAECKPEIAFGHEKTVELPQEAQEEPQQEIMENNYNVGKSGKVYTKGELLRLIRN
ncbi:MAG: hypothetical protein ACOYJU_02365 [Anaerovoracaceae bacterium]|jgi:hypothetical protein